MVASLKQKSIAMLRQKRGEFSLVVNSRDGLDASDRHGSIKVLIMRIGKLQSNFLNNIQVLGDIKLLSADRVELIILDSDIHLVVDIAPLRNLVQLLAILGVSQHEVVGLTVVIKYELFLQS